MIEINLRARKAVGLCSELEMCLIFNEGIEIRYRQSGMIILCSADDWKSARIPKRYKDVITIEHAQGLLALDELKYTGDLEQLDGYSFTLVVKDGSVERIFEANELDMEMNELTFALSEWAMNLAEKAKKMP